MSLGYAEKLSYIEDVGNVGMAEFFDPPSLFHQKVCIFTYLRFISVPKFSFLGFFHICKLWNLGLLCYHLFLFCC